MLTGLQRDKCSFSYVNSEQVTNFQGNVHSTGKASHISLTDCVFLAADIDSYIEYLAITYPDICQTEVIGRSFEGRDLKLLKVSTGGESNKPAIWIDGGEYVSILHISCTNLGHKS
jgi:murein tripeptide amidase MpaA